jgi:transposase InsO family protein
LLPWSELPSRDLLNSLDRVADPLGELLLRQISLRAECLDQHWFASLEDARRIIKAWWVEYNTDRPHTALNNQAPAAYRANWERQQQLRETG